MRCSKCYTYTLTPPALAVQSLYNGRVSVCLSVLSIAAAELRARDRQTGESQTGLMPPPPVWGMIIRERMCADATGTVLGAGHFQC